MGTLCTIDVAMDVSDLRQRILRALDTARVDAAARRSEADAARAAYETFLHDVAVPLLRQAQTILKAEGHSFTVHSPADAARLASDGHPETYLEFVFDGTSDRAQVICRTSIPRGGKRVIVDEKPVAPGKAIKDLGEQDVAALIVGAVPKLVR
jgi:hypothetical protein